MIFFQNLTIDLHSFFHYKSVIKSKFYKYSYVLVSFFFLRYDLFFIHILFLKLIYLAAWSQLQHMGSSSLLFCCSVAKLVQLFVTPQTIACQDPLSMGFPRQEYWSRLPFPSLGDLPDPRIEPASPGIKPGFPASATWSFSHWTTREVSWGVF